MSFGINVQGHRNVRRIVNDKKYLPWECDCPCPGGFCDEHAEIERRKPNPGYLKNCVDCGAKRP